MDFQALNRDADYIIIFTPIIISTSFSSSCKNTSFYIYFGYPDVSPDAMSKEEAGRIAAKTLSLSEDTFQGAVYIGDNPNNIWKVHLFVEFPDGTYDESDPYARFARYYVEVDSVTGEVKDIYQRVNHYDRWYINLVLQTVIEEVDATWVDTTPSFG